MQNVWIAFMNVKFLLFSLGLFLFGCEKFQTYQEKLKQMPSLSISVVDGAGRQLTFSAPPKRLAVLSPDVAEIISYYGKSSDVVVASSLCEPFFSNEVPILSVFPTLQIEDIHAFHPDLILAGGFYFDTTLIHAIQELQLPLFYFHPLSMDDLLQQLYMLGVLFEKKELAKRLRDSLQSEIQRIQKATERAARYKCLFYIDVAKGTVIGGRHLVNSLLTVCHVENLANSPYAYATIQPEDLVQSGVEILFIPDGSLEEFNNLLFAYPQLADLPAVRQNQVIQYHPESVFIYSPRVMDALAYLLSVIHPHIYGELFSH